MSDSIEYSEKALFAAPAASMPRIFGSPGRYVQGAGVIDQAGHYLSRLGFAKVVVLRTERCAKAEGGRLLQSMREVGLQFSEHGFGGECSIEEISAHTNALQDAALDGLVVIGGGKVVDAGRAIAQRLGIPVAVVPSLASNDAPCAAVSVIYSPEGVTEDAEVYDQNPALVLVDTEVVTAADPRYLVAGQRWQLLV